MTAGRRRKSICRLFAAVVFQSAMATVPSPAQAALPGRPYTGTIADWPLFFHNHLFGALCFETRPCSVTYHGFEFGSDKPTPAAASLAPDVQDNAMTASYGPVPRETPAARLRWQSKDGTVLEADVDVAAIFKDGLIRHAVPREDIPERIEIGLTHILVTIDDRTVSVYTRTMIPTKEEQIPGNRYSNFRDDLIQAYSRTY